MKQIWESVITAALRRGDRMRLIDADELLQTVSIKSVFGNEINKMKCGELRKILEMIEDAPTVEPPRIRGKWVKKDIVLTSNPPQYLWHCSSCMAVVHGMTVAILPDFCPHCGADMRGGQDD